MLTTGEQREPRLIEEELQKSDRRFACRLTLVQGMLRWATPGRQGCLLILAALAAALVWFAAAAERLLKELARGAVLMEPTIMVFTAGTTAGRSSHGMGGYRVGGLPQAPISAAQR